MIICMRTTLDLDDALLRSAKQRAAADGRTLTSLIEEGLRRVLASVDEQQARVDVVLPTFGGSGVHAGIDLADPAALRDVGYEEEDAEIRSRLSDAAP
jgi:Bacterial antitoxin of type II TA system, VapB